MHPHHAPPVFRRHRPRVSGLVAVPLGLIALVTVVDLLTSPNIHLGPLLVAAPALTAAFGGPVLTAVIGGLAVIAQIFIGVFHGGLFSSNHEAQILALIVVSTFVVFFRYAYNRHEQELVQVRGVAEVAQKVLLRPLPARIGPLRIASVYVAAEAEARIGGDLYATVRTPYGSRIMIGDVRGKGLTAVGDAALLLGAFRAAAHRNPTLPTLVAHLENTVYWDTVEPADPETAGESFITAAVLDVPDEEPLIRLINCGHPPPLLVHRGRVTELAVSDPALPLGLGGGLPASAYEAEAFPFAVNDLLVLYTDGVVETRDARGVFYPLAERVAAWGGTQPQHLVQYIHDDLLAHAGGALDDDVAVVVVERCE
ncbi:PP2C family protein-serine/threonine phosphatase [Streptomyces sp. NPDC001262]|uniref:PP2C family protein-serine/threonine phosphatase n=1 Tax=unclassified Streptomyces TaxID=2593676 RepID=UPI003690C775